LVLAIGIVVDDAIVVIEAVEQQIEHGCDPRTAALRAMDEVAGPIIAVGFVLTAVFVPCAFVSGIVGQFFRQFALTIAVSTFLSTINSLTLSPALAALLLRPRTARPDPLTWLLDRLFGWLFRGFNAGLRRSTHGYVRVVRSLIRVPLLTLAVYGGLLALTYWGLGRLPTGFIPSQDKGYLIASVQLPDSASAARTREVIARIETIARVKNVNSVAGNSFLLSAYGSNFGSMFIILEPFQNRRSPEQTSDKILEKIRGRFAKEIPEAQVNVFPPPAVSGLGRAGGFKIMVEDRGDLGPSLLQEQTDNLIAKGAEVGAVTGLFTVYKANSPQMFVDVDRDACLQQGVNLGDLFATMQGYLGSRYVNDFNRFGRTWQVIVQADLTQRDSIEDFRRLMVRNRHGRMVPLGSVARVRLAGGPLVLTRYNMYPAAAINGSVSAGVSTGQGIQALEALARRELPSSMSYEWTEITYLEKLSANTGMIVFALSVAFVFLVLAALYESWSLPLAVILVVPLCVLSSIAGVAYAKLDINVFTQIGFVVLIGLASKNAILIVEYAKRRREIGEDLPTAIQDACRLRLRPIIMTSFAFILGVVPLVIATGAGFEMRRALGTTVFSGMLGVTFFGLIFTPVFFAVIDRASHASLWRQQGWSFAASLAAAPLRWLRLGHGRSAPSTDSRAMTHARPSESVAQSANFVGSELPSAREAVSVGPRDHS
jgi:multidrug efflux pump